MFAKRLFQKVASQRSASHPPPGPHPSQTDVQQGYLTATDLDPRVVVHYGIPLTASILAFDPVQCLLAVGTLDGRIKVIGGDNIEGILISPNQLPFKNLEFIWNQGFLASVSNENEIQVWDLEHRQLASSLQWESNITAFSVIHGTSYMYVGDEFGMVSVLKYDADEGKLMLMPYYVPTNILAEAAGISPSIDCPVVGVLPQPCSQGNRLLIAFANGLIVLWDASEDRVVLVRSNRDLPLEGERVADSPKGTRDQLSDSSFDHDLVEKEISSLCWASNDGSVLAVGYVDGDILFWNLSNVAPSKDWHSGKSSNTKVVKLQLSSAERRLPVIVIHGSADRSYNDCGGQLFIYGGDEIGSEEVLTILTLDWTSGLESLKCVGRADQTLNGSFADMLLSPIAGFMNSYQTLLFILTNPGQLNVYEGAFLSTLKPLQDKMASVTPMQYPMIIPTMEPSMITAKLGLVCRHGNVLRSLSEIVSSAKLRASDNANTLLAVSTKWPLTGGIPCELFGIEGYQVERLYIGGYQDGSVRIWDATCPTLSLMYVIESEVNGVNVASASASVSALDFCSLTVGLAIGNECGMVRLYTLIDHMGETNLNIVTDTDKKVYNLHQGDGPQCTAVFSLLNSPVCALQFAEMGARLAVGFRCGRVSMLDISKSSVLFVTNSISNPNCPIISLLVKSFTEVNHSVNNQPEVSSSKSLDASQSLAVFVMTRDAHLVVLDGSSGHLLVSHSNHRKELTAVSMYIIEGGSLISDMLSEKSSLSSPLDGEAGDEPNQTNAHYANNPLEGELEASTATKFPGETLTSLLVCLVCEDALRLYSLKSLVQGDTDCIREVNLLKPCCWTTIFKKDNEECGLVVLYRTGVIEIRSFPDLEVVGESSLTSILRWNFKTNMDKTMCSSSRGHLVVINGCEFAILSLLAHENDFRIPESLPCLHDKVLAAAADAGVILSPNQRKSQDAAPGILGGIIKGFKVGNMEQNVDHHEVFGNNILHLESTFSCPPFLKPSTNVEDGKESMEINLNIDDIEIDEPTAMTVASSSQKSKINKTDMNTERERLFEGATTDTKTRTRTAEEIKAKYGRAKDTSVIASQARDKLLERKEKLERLSQRTEELQSGAENFASMAQELAKQMEKRKWWNI